jgi:hypothetical protein
MDDELSAFISELPQERIYVYVQWAEANELQAYAWFKRECLMHNEFYDSEFQDRYYAVPANRLFEVKQNPKANLIAKTVRE